MTWFALAVLVSLIGGLLLLAIGAVRRNRRGTPWRTVITTALLWVWGWIILALTFGTRSGGGSALNLAPLDLTNRADVLDFALNMLIFMPIGILLAIRETRMWVVLLVGAVGSLTIEIMQYVLATGRTADVNDLVSNTVGCLLGFLVTGAILRIVRRRHSTRSTEPITGVENSPGR